jgi:hypothetical protein
MEPERTGGGGEFEGDWERIEGMETSTRSKRL